VRMRKVSRFAAVLAMTAAAAFPVGLAVADSGTVLYEPNATTNPDEMASYEHAIRLQHSGDANGTILATFERQGTGTNPGPGWPIYRSTDDGASFQKIAHVAPAGFPTGNALQPNLLELAQPVAGYPAGTLLLAAETGAGSTLAMQVYRSTDHGVTWQYASDIELYTGGANRPWEPFLIQLDDGRIVAYYSEEVQPGPTYQQNIMRKVSTDGGQTWAGKQGVWVSNNPVDRPGMATVTRMGNGQYAMAVELCGGGAPGDYCRARVKFSSDGLTWGSPADMGIRPLSKNGQHPLHGNPVVSWTSAGGPNGMLILSGRDLMQSLSLPDNRAGGHGQTLLVNYNYGQGDWYELIAPIPWTGGATWTQAGYRNAVLPSADGTKLLYLVANYTGAGRRNRIAYGTASSGVLPYTAPFASGTDLGWKTFGGTWSVSGGVYANTSGGAGDKAITGSTYWSDYTMEGDVRLDGTGNAGLLVRANDPNTGADAHNGYFVGLTNQEGGVFLGRQNYNWTLLSGVHSMPGGVTQGAWYHLKVRVSGCTFTVEAQQVGGSNPPTTFTHTDTGCTMTRGAVGVRTFNTRAAWRNVKVS
jgi:hypothetical protein